MSFIKKFLKSRPVCKVRFLVSPETAGETENLCLSGDFNDWDPAKSPMKKDKNGNFFLDMELPSGKDYRFRYLADGGRWFNDADADAYVFCEFAREENSVIKV